MEAKSYYQFCQFSSIIRKIFIHPERFFFSFFHLFKYTEKIQFAQTAAYKPTIVAVVITNTEKRSHSNASAKQSQIRKNTKKKKKIEKETEARKTREKTMKKRTAREIARQNSLSKMSRIPRHRCHAVVCRFFSPVSPLCMVFFLNLNASHSSFQPDTPQFSFASWIAGARFKADFAERDGVRT